MFADAVVVVVVAVVVVVVGVAAGAAAAGAAAAAAGHGGGAVGAKFGDLSAVIRITLLAETAFHLDPAWRPTALIRAVSTLRGQGLELMPAHPREQPRSVRASVI